jgi:NitT/TauT family transport system substrate-binding protein
VNGQHPQRRALFARALVGLAAGAVAVSMAACGSSSSGGSGDKPQVKLGYFPNLTHASAIVGDQSGFFKQALSKDSATLKTYQFNSGSDTLNALASGDLDATYIGPSPALQAWVQQNKSVRIISGSAVGGAELVVKPSIKSVADLKGSKIATPSAGNTQDIALKYFLKEKGFKVSFEGKGDVTVINPQSNSAAITAYGSGDIDGAWMPEPYASQLVSKGAKVLVNEKDLWPNGQFVTTMLLAREDFIKKHPDLVNDLLSGQVQANDYIANSSDGAKKLVGNWLAKATGSSIDASVLDSAWNNLSFTNDPVASSFLEGARHSVDVGAVKEGTSSRELDLSSLSKIYDLGPLNKVLKAAGDDPVKEPSTS